MFNKWLGLLFLLFYTTTWAQESSTFVRQSYAITADTILLSPHSINNAFFKITDTHGTEIDSSAYWVDFSKAQLVFKPQQLKKPTYKSFDGDSLIVSWQRTERKQKLQ